MHGINYIRKMLCASLRRAECQADSRTFGFEEAVSHRTIGRLMLDIEVWIAINRAPFMVVGSRSLVDRHRNGVDEVSLDRRANPLNVSKLSFYKLPRWAYRQRQPMVTFKAVHRSHRHRYTVETTVDVV